MTIADISLEQRDLTLALPEGHFHDLKSNDIAPGKLTKTISGFANAAGGELYIGVEERHGPGGAKIRSWRGFADPEEANGHLQAFEQVSPLGTYARATFLRIATESGLVLQLEILKTREIVKATDRVVYVRRGAQNLPQTTEEQLARLRLDKGIASFETETVSTDASAVTNSTVVLEFLLNVVPTAEPEVWLRKQLPPRTAPPRTAAAERDSSTWRRCPEAEEADRMDNAVRAEAGTPRKTAAPANPSARSRSSGAVSSGRRCDP